ncbi:MAG: cation acetate symporter [Coriobacteriia bacterium]
MGNLNVLSIVLVVILISITIGLSWFSRRFTRTTADFYLAGRKVGSFTNASAISGDYLSAASFLGVAAAVYASGLDGVWYAAGFAGGFMVVVLFIASPLRRFGEYTVPDFAYGRFGTDRMRLVAVLGVLATVVFYMAPQMYGAGRTWEVLVGRGILGLSAYNSGVFVVALIIMIYVAVGGMKGTTLNQVIQFWWLAFAMFLVVVFAFGNGFSYPEFLHNESVDPMVEPKATPAEDLQDPAVMAEVEAAMRRAVQEAPDPEAAYEDEMAAIQAQLDEGAEEVVVPRFAVNKLHELENTLFPDAGSALFFNEPGHRYDAPSQFSMVLALVLGTAGLPHILNRYYTNPSGSAARRSTFWVLVFIGVFYILAPIAGLAGRTFVRQAYFAGDAPSTASYVAGLLTKSDQLMPTIARILGGEVLMGLVAAGAFAAMFSTLAGLTIAGSSAIGHDVYEKYINKDAPEAKRVAVAKISVVALSVLAAFIGWVIPASGLHEAFPALIAMMVTWAFAVGAGAFVPMLLMGIWWKSATERGAIAGMIVGGGGSVLFIFIRIFGALGHISPDAGLLGYFSTQSFPTLYTFPAALLAIYIVSKIDGQLPKNVDEIWMRIHGTAHERHEKELGLDKAGGIFASGQK